MVLTKCIRKSAEELQKAQDELWLAETQKSITRTSPIRDQLAEAAIYTNPKAQPQAHKKDPLSLLVPSAISRPKTHLIPQHSQAGMMAHPRKNPIQRAQYLILLESARNLWIAKGTPKEDQQVLSRLEKGLTTLDIALLSTKPTQKGEKSYEGWWRDAAKKLSPSQYQSIQEALQDLPSYFSLNACSKVTEPVTKSANVLSAQLEIARQPVKARGHIMYKCVQYLLAAGSWALNGQEKASDKLQEWSDSVAEKAEVSIY